MGKTRFGGSASRSATVSIPATIEPARLLLIRHRLATGFYHRDEVLDRIAARVARELR